MPSWMRLGGEYRVRFEDPHQIRFQPNASDAYLLHRVRLNLELKPTRNVRFFFQGQDARIFGNEIVSSAPPNSNPFDLRQAWVEFGQMEKRPLTVRLGRQELAYGEERLVGASNWANAARTFDAVRAVWRTKNYRVDAFSSSVVVVETSRFDHHRQGDNLHGIYAGVSGWIPKARLEPYTFWRVAPRVRNEANSTGKLDLKTPGFRLAGDLPYGFDYVTEMAFQFGSAAGDDIRAWAGHWRTTHALGGSTGWTQRWKPRLRVEYNFATGDRDPYDGKRETFDVLYPTPHDKYGLADQVGWRNVHHLGVSVEAKPNSAWTIQTRFHDRWLDSATDGLYAAPGTLLFRDPEGNSGRHIGEEIDFQILWNPVPALQVGGGIGHIFPGEFLRKTSPGKGYTWPYASMTYSF